MSPTADAAGTAVGMDAVAAQELLDDGEIIILAVKPSLWYAAVISAPVVIIALIIAGGAALSERVLDVHIHAHFIYVICAAAVCLRGMVACAQWVGKLYVLTSRRVLNLTGITKVSIDECPLGRIGRTHLSASTGEHVFCIATLMFESTGGKVMETTWACLANPTEVQEAVDQAIRQSR